MAKPKFPPVNGWDRHSIYAEILRQGMTLQELAKRAGITPRGVSHVWTRTARTAEKVISEFLETPAEELWPDRYRKQTSYRVSTSQMTRHARANSPSSSDQEAA
ncbi:helix-turn-helix domain-containing protein [Roseibium sp. TrichSKD4]|uniref:helix-turn-helix domain-containing protein n=1 Tax=Roseibium sp. TrichSKD4 TaxID=744980 RepID=UPI000A052CDA|nr:helix-turn-helix domain-containing protein [Roseibium sp. TrichSKD4]